MFSVQYFSDIDVLKTIYKKNRYIHILKKIAITIYKTLSRISVPSKSLTHKTCYLQGIEHLYGIQYMDSTAITLNKSRFQEKYLHELCNDVRSTMDCLHNVFPATSLNNSTKMGGVDATISRSTSNMDQEWHHAVFADKLQFCVQHHDG